MKIQVTMCQKDKKEITFDFFTIEFVVGAKIYWQCLMY